MYFDQFRGQYLLNTLWIPQGYCTLMYWRHNVVDISLVGFLSVQNPHGFPLPISTVSQRLCILVLRLRSIRQKRLKI